MPLPAHHRPVISVIIPEDFLDSRSDPEFLREWAAQTCDPADYEIVLVMQQGVPQREDAARRYLRDSDTLLVCDLPNETAGYDIGARVARGRWLLISENHVLPESDCLEKIMAFLEAHPDNPVMPGSTNVSSARVGRAEGVNFDRMLAEHWSQPGSWHRVHIRGFVIRTDDYFRAGGLPARYASFSPTLLAESLHSFGVEVNYLEDRVLRHVNSPTFAALNADIADTAEGQCRFRDESRPNREHMPAIPVPAASRLRHAVLILRTVMRNGGGPAPKTGRRSRGRLMKLCVSNLCSSLMRGRTGHFFSGLAYGGAKARFYCTRPGSEAEHAAFLRIWRRMICRAELRWSESPREIRENEGAVPFADLPTHQLAGFYGLETYDGKPFRWSEPVCDIRIRLNRTGHRVTLDTGCLRGSDCQFCFHLFINGRRIPGRQIQIEDGRISFIVPGNWIDRQPVQLTIVTAPLSEAGGDRLHPRQLGMPMFEIQFDEESHEKQLPQLCGRAA